MISFADHNIDWQRPVNPNHHLNHELHGWWMVTPYARGGSNFWDLTNENFSLIRDNVTAINTAWRPAERRRGGWGSLFLDGSNDDVLFDSNKATTAMSGFGRFTIMAWIKTSSGLTQSLWGAWDGSDDGCEFDINRGAGLDEGGAIFGICRTGVTSDLTGYTADTGIDDGNWHHLAYVADHSSQEMLFYVDGKNWATTYTEQAVGGTFATYDRSILFGAVNAQGTVDNTIDGHMDDVRFYRRCLSASEVDKYWRLSQQGYPGILNRISAPYMAGAAAAGVTIRQGLHAIKHGAVRSLHSVEAGAV